MCAGPTTLPRKKPHATETMIHDAVVINSSARLPRRRTFGESFHLTNISFETPTFRWVGDIKSETKYRRNIVIIPSEEWRNSRNFVFFSLALEAFC